MPGIAGIISSSGSQNFSASANAMIGTMMHEPFYKKASRFVPEMNIYAGAATFENSADGIFSNEREDILLIFSGECFIGSENGTGQKLIRLYEQEGEKFLEKLNGLFCGLLIDKQSSKVFLFNDRYAYNGSIFMKRKAIFTSPAKPRPCSVFYRSCGNLIRKVLPISLLMVAR
jgi:asparagine synthetase B (glutamine-hydrolysing)